MNSRDQNIELSYFCLVLTKQENITCAGQPTFVNVVFLHHQRYHQENYDQVIHRVRNQDDYEIVMGFSGQS